MLNHTMEQVCLLVETSYNDDGDLVYNSSKEIPCRFRWITDLDKLNNRESIRADAMLWVKAEENIIEGSVIKFNDEYFRVRQLIEARRLRGETIYFKKCLLDKQASGIENGSQS